MPAGPRLRRAGKVKREDFNNTVVRYFVSSMLSSGEHPITSGYCGCTQIRHGGVPSEGQCCGEETRMELLREGSPEEEDYSGP